MTNLKRPSSWRGLNGVVVAVVTALLLTLHPTLAQQTSREAWVATWGTAVVGRPWSPPLFHAAGAPATRRRPGSRR